MNVLVREAALADEVLDVPDCVARVRRGDEDAARSLLTHLFPLVLSVVRGHRPRRMSEDDLTQTVFLKVFTKLDQYSGAVPLEHWVSRIAVNTCLNALQAEKIRPELRWADMTEEEEHVIQALDTTAGELEPGHSLAARDLTDKLLDCLKPNDRLLVNLLHVEGHSVEEVKQITGWNISMIKVRAFRARKRMRKHMEDLMKEETQ